MQDLSKDAMAHKSEIPSTIENERDKLAQSIEKLKGDITELTRQAQSKSQEVKVKLDSFKTLDSAIEDIENVLNAYGSSLDNMERKNRALKDYFETKSAMTEAIVKEKNLDKSIHDITHKIDDEIAQLTQENQNKKNQLQSSELALKNLNDELKDATDSFNGLKIRKKTVEENQKVLDALKKRIEKLEEENKLSLMYYLLSKRFHNQLDLVLSETLDFDSISKALHKQWKRQLNAKNDQGVAQQKFDTAKKSFEVSQIQLDKLKKEREGTITAKLGEIISAPKIATVADTGDKNKENRMQEKNYKENIKMSGDFARESNKNSSASNPEVKKPI